jgi:hypothetical protein
VISRRRWTILAVGTFAQASTCSFLYGIPMLVPALRHDDHLSLFGASLIISAPMAGLLVTRIAWGAAVGDGRPGLKGHFTCYGQIGRGADGGAPRPPHVGRRAHIRRATVALAEDRGFEPLRDCSQPAFQASAIGH